MNARSIITRAALSVIPALCVSACTTGDNPVEPQPGSGLRGTGVHLVAVTPTNLTAVVNNVILPTPTVIVRDSRGTRVSGILVRFKVSGGGMVAYKAAVTDEDGLATPGRWTASTLRGSQTLAAFVEESTDSVVFTAEGIPDVPVKLFSLVYDDGIDALPGETVPVVAQLADRYGNNVNEANIPVTFSMAVDNGSGSSVDIMTNGSGQARFQWILGTEPVNYTLTVSAPDLSGFTRRFKVLDLRSTTVYDLETIASNPPRDRTIEKGYITLDDDGSFVDVVTGVSGFELEGTVRASGNYEKQAEGLTLKFSTDYWENARFSGDYLLVDRWDPNTYTCCVVWAYKKRMTQSP